MIEIKAVIFLIFVHFVSDFMLQSDKMAKNKSSSNKWLSIHVLIYSIPFFCLGWKFVLINGIAHWCTDFVTSRWTSYLWKKQDVHNFFVVIGLDQAIHMITLILTYVWLV